MSIFNYTLPSGATYKVVGPDNATQTEADLVFYSQVAAGALVGYTAGQTLSSTETQLSKFELSRLDRGTAGVDEFAILAIIGASASFNGTSISAAIPTLNGIPLQNPITQANVITNTQGLGVNGIGPLTSTQVQTLMAQNAAQVNQLSTEISNEKGVGKYGFNSQQLEEAGFLKPGTTLRYFGEYQVPGAPNPPNFVQVLSSAAVWTGLDGIYTLQDLLDNQQEQDHIQQILMANAYEKLTNAGIIQTSSVAGVTAATGFVYTATSSVGGTLSSVNSLGTITSSASVPTGLAGEITTALNDSGVATSVLSPAQTLANATANDTGFTNPLTSVSSALATGQKVLAQVQQNVGAVLQVASKFGTQAAELLKGGLPGLESKLGGIVKGQIAGIQNQATALVKGVEGQAQAVVNQGKAVVDQVGKMGKYAVDFANGKIDSLTSGVKSAAAYVDTVNRTNVDQAVKGILGNAKIPAPDFGSASALAASTNADIAYAQKALSSASNQINQVLASGQQIAGTVQGTVNQGQALFGQAKGIATGAASQAQNLGTNLGGTVQNIGTNAANQAAGAVRLK